MNDRRKNINIMELELPGPVTSQIHNPAESLKWHTYGDDVLPLWVADMDFQSPEPVIRALREHVDRGIFGYGREPPELRGVMVDWIMDRYGWPIQPEWLVFVPGVPWRVGVCFSCGDPVVACEIQHPPLM